MLLAAELDAGLDAPGVAAAALRRGVIVNPVTPTALRLAPPLVLTNDELAHGVSTLGEVLAVAMADGGPPDTGSAP
jgi:acetylornithine/succinyldiaminopimelate/putrescine aminotransferase